MALQQKKRELQALFDEPFCGVHIIPPTPTEDTALSKEKAKVEELSAKVQTLSIRNVNKQIKRRDVKLAQSQAQVKEINREQKAQDKTIKKLETRLQSAQSSVHCLRQRIYRSKHKNEDEVDSMSQENSELRAQLDDIEEAFSSKVAELEERIEMLITEVELARHECDILSERLDDDLSIGTNFSVTYIYVNS